MNKTLVETTREIILEGFEPQFGKLTEKFSADPLWSRLAEVGTEPWLDTGDIEAISKLWTREMKAVTTNNTLLNREVQKGTYDELVPRAARLLKERCGLSGQELIREIAFILNAYHGLRLVERFDAYVSVELHTDLSQDLERTAAYAERYHQICPERFYVKIPFTAEGILAARRVGKKGVPINLTLGFSARANLVVAAVADAAYCNVFLGRLNQVVIDNKLGDGKDVGERSLAASQAVVKRLRDEGASSTRQIAASMRTGEQAFMLAGTDVFTMPPKVAEEFHSLGVKPSEVISLTERDFSPQWAAGVDPEALSLNDLWEISDELVDKAKSVAGKITPETDGPALRRMLKEAGIGAILPEWSAADFERAGQDGKIPHLEHWKKGLGEGRFGLDALMTLSGLASFTVDQTQMDERIKGLI